MGKIFMNVTMLRISAQRGFERACLCGFGLLLVVGMVPYGQAAGNELKGTYFESTRVIYPEEARQGKSIVLNNNSDKDFLLRAYVSLANVTTGLPEHPTRDFLVTPPLARLGAHQTRALRLLRTGGQFPTDRESVFFLTASLIPNEGADTKKPASDNQAVVKFLTAVSVKVFWRPNGLDKPNAVEEAAGKLKGAIIGNVLTLSNPTPYYVTLRSLSVGGADVPATDLVRLVPPLGQQDYPVPAGAKRASVIPVIWTAIKESGFDTTPFLSPVAVSSATGKQP
ncbi:molecular chaperone [Serratia marcescens]|uniref:fimbrial biogenesis chaperone n=1 Tax=Serratia marcescens TaxID=615 RepID=UPI001EEFA802|nr:molecular chaperone [Serratia marcescens]ULH10498.1 molecular chaperone [Serratia marcescens]